MYFYHQIVYGRSDAESNLQMLSYNCLTYCGEGTLLGHYGSRSDMGSLRSDTREAHLVGYRPPRHQDTTLLSRSSVPGSRLLERSPLTVPSHVLLIPRRPVAEPEEPVARLGHIEWLRAEVLPARVLERAHGVQTRARPEADDAPLFFAHFVPGTAFLTVDGLKWGRDECGYKERYWRMTNCLEVVLRRGAQVSWNYMGAGADVTSRY